MKFLGILCNTVVKEFEFELTQEMVDYVNERLALDNYTYVKTKEKVQLTFNEIKDMLKNCTTENALRVITIYGAQGSTVVYKVEKLLRDYFISNQEIYGLDKLEPVRNSKSLTICPA